MDVTSSNFIEALTILDALLPTADFVAFDLEFTGLGDTRPSQLDTPRIRYESTRADAESFPPIQFGLAVFRRKALLEGRDESPDVDAMQVEPKELGENGVSAKEPDDMSSGEARPAGSTENVDEEEQSWQVIPFNFNIFPRAVYYPHNRRYPYLDRIFKLQSSTVHFLTSHGFDFMRAFTEGVTWLRSDNEEKVREHVSSLLQKKRFPEKRANNELSKADRQALDKFKHSLSEWLTGLSNTHKTQGKSSFPKVRTIPIPRAPFQRRIIFDYIRDEHPFIVPTIMETQQGAQIKLLLYPCVEDAKAKKQQDFNEEVESELFRFVAFRYVIDALRTTQVPIVVHNGLMDIVKLYANFVGPLPVNMTDFKVALSQAFPFLYDTRWILHKLSSSNNVLNKIMEGDKIRSISETYAALRKEWKKLCPVKPQTLNTFIPTMDVRRNHVRIGKGYVRPETKKRGLEVTQDTSSLNPDDDVYKFGRYAASEPGKYDHEAGFDAQETGRLFILLMQLISATASANEDGNDNDYQSFKNRIYLGSCGGYSSIDLTHSNREEENLYLQEGNAILVTGEWTEGNKQKDTPYQRCRYLLRTLTEGTDFDGNSSTFSLVGPEAMLAVLDMKSCAAQTGKRKSEGYMLTIQRHLQTVIANGDKIGITVKKYEDAIADTEIASKRRKCA